MSDEVTIELVRRSVETSAGRAGYAEAGEGLPVIALHGLPGSLRDFRWLAARIAPQARFVALDTPGFGETSAQLAPPTIAGISDHVQRVMDALLIDRAVLLAHSFGSTFAIHAAAHHRSRTRGLALLAPVGLRRHRAHRRTRSPKTLGALTELPAIGPVFASVMALLMRAAGMPKYLRGPEAAQTLKIAGNLNFTDHVQNITRVEAPSLVAWCDDDEFVEHDIIEDLAPRLPEGPRLHFSSGGHSLLKSRAGEIGDTFLTWISGLK